MSAGTVLAVAVPQPSAPPPDGQEVRGTVPLRTLLGIVAFHAVFYTLFFCPVWLDGKRLCYGDSLCYYYPAYVSGHALWEPALMGGYPKFADPQFQLWYPPALVCSLLGLPFDVYDVLAYVLAGTFAHAYLRRLTGSWTAGCLAGLVFGTCAFMTTHHGHTTIIHVAAWLPLLLWAVEELRQRVRLTWVSILAGAVGCCVLAGHPQVAVLCLLLTGCYFACSLPGAPAGHFRFLVSVVSSLVLGVALTAIQTLPTAEFTELTARSAPNYEYFCSYHFPRGALPTLIFPYAYGWFKIPGQEREPTLLLPALISSHEWLACASMLAVISAFAALLCGYRQRYVWFWLAVLTFALLAALGNDAPLAKLLYHVPLLNRSRCPGRFALWYGMASACLCGHALQCLLRLPPRRALQVTGVALTLAFGVAATALWVYKGQRFHSPFDPNAIAGLAANSPFRSAKPWRNPSLGLPFVCLLLSGLSLTLFVTFRNRLTQVALIACTILDGGSCAWLWPLADNCVPATALETPPGVRELSDITHQHHTRLFSTLRFPVCPNANLLVGVDCANYYGPVPLQRFTQLLPYPVSLQSLLAIEYWEAPVRPGPFGIFSSYPLDKGELGQSPGHPGAEECRFPVPNLPIRGLSIVSCLGNSTAVTQGTPVVEVLVRGVDGSVSRAELQAGRDTAEWALDVVPTARHGYAPLFESIPAESEGRRYLARRYIAKVQMAQTIQAEEVIFRWIGPTPASCVLTAVTLTGPNGESYPYLNNALAAHQGPAEAIPGTAIWLAHTKTPPPRAWLVPRAVSLPAEQILQIVATGRMPDGRAFDPYQMVLIEGKVASTSDKTAADPAAQIDVLGVQSGWAELRTRSSEGGVLVLTDTWYPGWRVQVDGKRVPLLRADYLIRAVEVPPGEHRVTFVFRPTSFYRGLALTLGALAVVAFLPFLPWGFRRMRLLRG